MNALEIKNLTKSYSGFTLDNLNLTLPNGCILGLIGENGAGKSTTIKLILDMIHKDSGTVTIFGRDNTDNIHLTKEDIGVVLDEVGIPECMTVEQAGKVMRYISKPVSSLNSRINASSKNSPGSTFPPGNSHLLGFVREFGCLLSNNISLFSL